MNLIPEARSKSTSWVLGPWFLRIARRLRAQAKSALQLPSAAKTKRPGCKGGECVTL